MCYSGTPEIVDTLEDQSFFNFLLRQNTLFSDVKNVFMLSEKWQSKCPLQIGCPFLGQSFIEGSAALYCAAKTNHLE